MPVLLDSFVFFDFAVADVDDAVGVQGDVVFVGDQYDGVALLIQPLEEVGNLRTNRRHISRYACSTTCANAFASRSGD